MSELDQLALLAGDLGARGVTLDNGTRITLSPLVLAELPHFARRVRPLLQHPALPRLVEQIAAAHEAHEATPLPPVETDAAGTVVTSGTAAALPEIDLYALSSDLVDLFADRGEQLLGALAYAVHMAPEDLGALRLDDMLRLLVAVVIVNADFFARKVLPAILSAVPATQPASEAPSPQAGPMSGSA